jgi:hypothetical protein
MIDGIKKNQKPCRSVEKERHVYFINKQYASDNKACNTLYVGIYTILSKSVLD